MKDKIVDAEIVEDEFLAPVQVTAKTLTNLVNVDALIKKHKKLADTSVDTNVEDLQEIFLDLESARKEFTNGRIKLKKEAEAMREPFTAFSKLVIKIEKEVQAKINPFENKLRVLTDKVENEEKRKQREAEEAEELRIDTIKTLMTELQMLPLKYTHSSSNDIQIALDDMVYPTVETFNEFLDAVVNIYNEVSTQMRSLLETKQKAEQADEILAKQSKIAKEKEDEAIREQQEKQAVLDKEREEFEAEKAKFAQHQQSIQEEANRKVAEKEADELQEQQEIEAKAKKSQDEKDFNYAKLDSLERIREYEDYEELLLAIIENKIPYIKWEM